MNLLTLCWEDRIPNVFSNLVLLTLDGPLNLDFVTPHSLIGLLNG